MRNLRTFRGSRIGGEPNVELAENTLAYNSASLLQDVVIELSFDVIGERTICEIVAYMFGNSPK